MKSESVNKRILLIDNQPYWREISTNALREAGFTVDMLETYHDLASQECVDEEKPELVLLGCKRIGTEEQQLIDEVLNQKQHLLVLCTSLSWLTMRTLFLKGVDDILDKPYNPAKLVNIVRETLENIFGYQTLERNGIV